MLNRTVKYESLQNPGKWFIARVVRVYPEHCVIRFNEGLRMRTVVILKSRLTVLDLYTSRFAGRPA